MSTAGSQGSAGIIRTCQDLLLGLKNIHVMFEILKLCLMTWAINQLLFWDLPLSPTSSPALAVTLGTNWAEAGVGPTSGKFDFNLNVECGPF